MFSIIRLNEIIDVSLGLIGVYRLLGVEASPNITFSVTLIFAFPLTLLPLFSTILFLVPVIHARMHLTRTFSGFRVACSFQPVYEIGFVRLGKVPHFPGLSARACIPIYVFAMQRNCIVDRGNRIAFVSKTYRTFAGYLVLSKLTILRNASRPD